MKKKQILLSLICVMIAIAFTVLELSGDKFFTKKTFAKIFKDPAEVTYITKIEMNFKQNVKLSPAYTYREAMHLFEEGWTSPDGSGYVGTNAYFYYCPDDNPCAYEDTNLAHNNEHGYNFQVNANRYHWVMIEVEAEGCAMDAEYCPTDFRHDEDYKLLDDIEVWVNGVKNTNAIVYDYNEHWRLVHVVFPVDLYTGALVKDIAVDSATDYVTKGTSLQFDADVDYYGEEASHIAWSVIGVTSNNTTINNNGLLSVAANEEASYIKVRATSTFDNTVYDEKDVNVIDEPLSITSVTMDEEEKTVIYGGSYTFHAKANGTGGPGVTWSVSGANKVGTTISEDGTLTVAADETATSVTVCAKSTFDNTKKACLMVTLRATIIINKIEISYDPEAAVFSSKTTYGDAADVLKRVASSPKEAGYIRDGGVWIAYCDTDERCTTDLNYDGNVAMKMDKYTYIDFYIYAKPEEYASLNPLYDFDQEHLDDIEIWVNGVERNDAFIDNYDSTNRRVDVYVPIIVTDGKLAQYMSFYNDTDYITYGDEPEKNGMRTYERIGDGEVTYKSSDETIATVDSEGYVTAVKVGTCTITATASETEDYKEFSASYTLEVLPKHVWPTISGFDQYPEYTGSPIRPEIMVTINDGEVTLVKDVDYTIQYGENTEVGAGYIQIYPVEGSNYTFAAPHGVNVYVQRRTITEEDVTVSTPVVVYTGELFEPDVIIKVLGNTLIENVDYTISYSSNLNVGTAYISIYGSGNYTGYVGKTFEIVECMPGDMNKNGKIDLADIILLLKKYLNGDATDEEITIGDMDSNGSIGLNDIILLLKLYLVG